jgi:NAD(P)-dependent dehydrogenase (short-subunit alcohol dehydrogenase family)
LAAELDQPFETVDATDFEQVERSFRAASERFGGLNGAVNCVGSILLKPAHLTSAAEWYETINANLTSAFATVRAAAKVMQGAPGSVVLVASAAARLGLPSHEAIAASKAGVIGLARAAAATYAARGLRFNVVAPGLVKTKMTEKIWSNDRSAEASRQMHALGRLGEPGDIAQAIDWLLDSNNSWITGEVISVDGGLAHVRANVR